MSLKFWCGEIKMTQTKPIYRLPELLDHQVWDCDNGCDDAEPELHANVYKQVWDKESGKLIERHAEHYYTCRRGHILSVLDNQTSKDVKLPDEAYTEHDNPHNLTLDDVDRMLEELKGIGEKFSGDLDLPFSFARASIQIMNGDEILLNMTSDYLKEIRALLTAHLIA
ncbi:hypothetical protein D3C78_1106080 [compost metagenome]